MAAVLINASISSVHMNVRAIKDINYQVTAERVSMLTNVLNMDQLICVPPKLLNASILPVLIIATVRLDSEMMEVVRIV
jgi:hypothetical protein